MNTMLTNSIKGEKEMKKGFSLVELLVVLVVIGVILAIVLPNTLKAIEQANIRDTAATLKSIDTAINVCYSEKRDWSQCNTLSLLTAPGANNNPYLDTLPNNNVDPFGVAYSIEAGPSGSFRSNKTAHFPNWPSLATHNGAGN